MVHVLVGNNFFGMKSAIDKIVTDFKTKNGNLNIEKFDGSENEQADFLASLNSMSLFGDDKLVIIENFETYKSLSEDLNKFLDTVDDQVTLIIVEKQIDKRSSYYKNLKKLPGFKEFGDPSEAGLLAWIKNYTDSLGGQISTADAQYLVDRIGPNQTLLEREITKLVQYSKDVNRQSIDLLTDATPSTKIFDLVDRAFAGRVDQALKIYDDQRAQRVEPQAILGMLIWQMHLVAVCAVSDKSSSQLAAETGLKEFSLSKAKNIAMRMKRSGVEKFLDLLADIEITSKKQTYNLDDGLKLAIISLAN